MKKTKLISLLTITLTVFSSLLYIFNGIAYPGQGDCSDYHNITYIDVPTDTNAEIILDGNPSEEFWTSLGIDEGIKVDYKFLKKYQKDEGLFSKKCKFIFEYLIIIKNNKKTSEEILVTDQIPISTHDDIKVDLIEPQYKEDTQLDRSWQI